jgi:hypothetical protein
VLPLIQKRRQASRWALITVEIGAVLVLGTWGFLWSSRPDKGFQDYGSFIASGLAANDGLDPYGVYDLTFRVGAGGMPAPNLNPPLSVYLFRLAATLDPARSAAAWFGLSFCGLVLALVLLARAYPQNPAHAPTWAFAFAGFWQTLETGQIYVPLLLCATAAWLLLRRGDDWRAGLATGVIAAFKPQFGLWPVLLLCSRHWRSGATGLGTVAVLTGFPLVVNGWQIYQQWLAATPPMLPGNTFAGNGSILAVATRLDADRAGAVVTAALIVMAMGFAWRARPRPIQASALALVVALLAGPLTWCGYTLFLFPVLFAMGWRAAMPGVLFLAFPFWVVISYSESSPTLHLFLGSVYFCGIALIGWALFRRRWQLVA